MKPFEKITAFLDEQNVPYELVAHEPVYTSEQAAAVRGFSMDQGAKSLLLKVKNSFVLCILPGSKRLDMKKVRSVVGAGDIRFAKPEEVVQIMGCEIGACYPFGNLIDVPMYVDPTLANNDIISFNPGLHDKSIKMAWKSYAQAVQPNIQNLITE